MAKKPKKKAPKPTEILVVLDRSGSMTPIRADTIGGLNTFVEEQKKIGGKCWLTLLQFDHELKLVHQGVPMADVPELTEETYVPRGSTALLDAIARGVGLLEELVAGTKKLAHLVILTDGEENASHEVSAQQVFSLIDAKKKVGWAIQYIGAGQDAIDAATRFGIDPQMAAAYDATPETTRSTFAAVSRGAASHRSTGMAGQAAFLSTERSAMSGSDLVDSTEAAAHIGVSTRTLARMDKNGRGPAPVRPSGKPRGRKKYRRQDLSDWLLRESE